MADLAKSSPKKAPNLDEVFAKLAAELFPPSRRGRREADGNGAARVSRAGLETARTRERGGPTSARRR